jgi:hypothetical protein
LIYIYVLQLSPGIAWLAGGLKSIMESGPVTGTLRAPASRMGRLCGDLAVTLGKKA